MNIGIIGTGDIAGNGHALAIQQIKGAKLMTVLSRNEDSGKAFLQKHEASEARVYTELADFAQSKEADLVIVASPDRLHYEQAKACLEAGKHVLLEKPMALSNEEALELTQLAETKSLTLAIGFHLRSHVGHRFLRERLAAGELGALRHIRVVWAFPQADDSNWRAHEDLTKWWSLSAVGSHCLDLARWFADDTNDWKQFTAVNSNAVWHGPHDETAVIAGQLTTDVTVEVVSSVVFGPFNRIEIFGSKGSAMCDNTLGRAGAGTITINGEPLAFTPANPFVEQLQDVISAITRHEQPRANSAAGVRSVQDLLLASRSELV